VQQKELKRAKITFSSEFLVYQQVCLSCLINELHEKAKDISLNADGLKTLWKIVVKKQ
jgi:hypothetical protein